MSALQQEKEILTLDGLLIEDVCLCSMFLNQLHYSHVNREVIRLLMVLHNMLCIFRTLLCGWRMFHHLFFLYFRLI